MEFQECTEKQKKLLEDARNMLCSIITTSPWALIATSEGADLERRRMAHKMNTVLLGLIGEWESSCEREL